MYLIPNPHFLKRNEGTYLLNYTGCISLDASCGAEVYEYAKLLQQEILDDTGFHYSVVPGASKYDILLKQGDLSAGKDVSDEKQKMSELKQENTYNLKSESYQLEISADGICIIGIDSRGLLWGVQTLRQIIRQECAKLPCLFIQDAPDIPNRGFYHDATRSRVPKLSWLKQLADTLSFYKINQLQLYVEHSYLFEHLSEMWRDDTPLTAEEIMELDRYCQKRGIELVPSLSSFGHLYKLLRTRQYRQLCELEHPDQEPFSFIDRMMHHTINVSDSRGIELVKSMLKEYMQLFTSRKFNLCADETFDLGKGKNREKREAGGGESCLYIPYVKELCQFIVKEGRTPMIWGDRLIAFPELSKELPEETVCLNWNYDPQVLENDTHTYAQIGMRQYVCPGVNGWNHLINPLEDSWKNISRMCSYGAKYHAEGVLNTDWGDFGHVNHPLHSIPGMIYGATASWNHEQLSYEEMNRQISAVEYQDRTGSLLSIISELSTLECFGWRQAVTFKEKPCLISGCPETLEAEIAAKNGEDDICCLVSKDGVSRRILTPESKKTFALGAEKNLQIRNCMKKLTSLLASMDSSRRDRIYPWLLAAEGMEILNSIGSLLVLAEQTERDIAEQEPLRKEAYRLAERLENWYYQYRQLWHTVSKEAELYQVGEVIFWYADYLRDL